MRNRDILRPSLFAALAAVTLVAATAQTASAQKVVAPTCPEGYVLSGSNCIQTNPVSSKPGKASSGGQWAFVTREAYGVKSAAEVDGANFCAVEGSPAVDAATDFFKDNGLNATHIKVADDRAGIETYQKYDCDLLVVDKRVAASTADKIKPKGDHMVLPERFGKPAPVETATPPATVKKTPAPATVKKTPAPAKSAPVRKASRKPVRRVRCSAVRYGYTRGNTCACAGRRVFNGSRCVRRRW